jgi:hypothetical protein
MTVRQLRQALFAIRDQDRPIEAAEVLALLSPTGDTQVEPAPPDGTQVELARVERLAIRDADAIYETYRGEPSRVFDGRANGAWHAAAAELGVDPHDPNVRALYLKTLVARCGQISDEQD